MDAINNFYNDCITIDKAVEQLSISKQLEQKTKAIHDALSKIALESDTQEVFKEKKERFTNLIFPDPTVVPASSPLAIIQNKIQNINSILNYNIGTKLKKIAGYK